MLKNLLRASHWQLLTMLQTCPYQELKFRILLLKEEWLSPVFEELQRIDLSAIHSEYTQLPSPYYVRMGMAWLLATALAKYPDETRSFVNASSLTEDVKRLYARKARESFRTRHVPAF